METVPLPPPFFPALPNLIKLNRIQQPTDWAHSLTHSTPPPKYLRCTSGYIGPTRHDVEAVRHIPEKVASAHTQHDLRPATSPVAKQLQNTRDELYNTRDELKHAGAGSGEVSLLAHLDTRTRRAPRTLTD